MRAHDVIRVARDRAGLTQQQLAVRSGRPRETIARWESGSQIPSLETVSDVVDSCELELVLRLTARDTTLAEHVHEQLRLTPYERLVRLLAADAVDDVVRSLSWLAGADTPTIVIGQVGAALLGAPQRPDSAQVEFVAADAMVLERLLQSAGLVPIEVEDRWRELDARAPWTLPTGGTLVFARHVSGTGGYRDLRRSAVSVDLTVGGSVLVAHPRDLLRIADASTRESERARTPGLQALLEATSS